MVHFDVISRKRGRGEGESLVVIVSVGGDVKPFLATVSVQTENMIHS